MKVVVYSIKPVYETKVWYLAVMKAVREILDG